MTSRRVTLWLLAASFAIIGVWAQFAPASFHASFPAGRGWVALDGPYNEHLIRDVGGLNLALAVLLAVAAIRLRGDLTRLVSAATLVYGVPHFAYHTLHLEPYGPVDAAANVASLALTVIVPLWLVIAPTPRVLREQPPRGGVATGGH